MSVFDDEFATCWKPQSFSNELKEEYGSQEPNKNATPNHVTMISQREKATGGISNVSKHLWSGLMIL